MSLLLVCQQSTLATLAIPRTIVKRKVNPLLRYHLFDKQRDGINFLFILLTSARGGLLVALSLRDGGVGT